MKNYIALFLLVCYLLNFTNFGELTKIPAMLEHYKEHQQESPKISLLEFLHIHYAHGIVLDEDFSKDMKLPFKSESAFSQTAFSLFTPFPEFKLHPIFIDTEDAKLSSIKDVDVSSGFQCNIWQPPKFS